MLLQQPGDDSSPSPRRVIAYLCLFFFVFPLRHLIGLITDLFFSHYYTMYVVYTNLGLYALTVQQLSPIKSIPYLFLPLPIKYIISFHASTIMSLRIKLTPSIKHYTSDRTRMMSLRVDSNFPANHLKVIYTQNQ